MRIVHLIPSLSGGGAETQLSYLGPELVALGHEVHIIFLHTGPKIPKIEGVILHQIKVSSNYTPAIFFRGMQILKSVEPDIIQTWIFQMDIVGGVISKILGIPWVLREPTSSQHYKTNWKSKLRIFLGRRANAIVSNSIGGDTYWKKYVDQNRRYLVRNGLPFHIISKTNPYLPSNRGHNPIVLSVGRLAADSTANKNIKYLLEAAALANKDSRFDLFICGDGPQREELESYSKVLAVQNVFFTGFLDKSKIWSIMKKADLFISLSSYEGCPNSVLEAMACGCQLILSDIPAHREILDEETAIFVDPSDTQQIEKSIQFLLSNLNEARKKKIQQKASNFNIRKMATHYESIYKNLL